MIKNTALARFIRTTAFLLVLIFVLIAASYMLAPKDNTLQSGMNNPNARGFFSEEQNTIDISVIGNSDAYSGFSPMELWNNYGYTSYVSAEGRQSVSQSYSMLKNVLTCQSPKIVMLEADGMFTKENITKTFVNIFYACSGSAFSVFQYHDRWKSVTPAEMLKKPNYTSHCVSKGQMLSNTVKGYNGGEYMRKTDEVAKIPESSIKAFDAFVKLCNNNDITLILFTLPSQNSWNYRKHNAVQRLADENGIDFIDLNIDRENFGFDWKTDTRDKGNHLNTRGARKTTLYLGEYLKNNYALTDRRGDENYKSWDEDYKIYKSKAEI